MQQIYKQKKQSQIYYIIPMKDKRLIEQVVIVGGGPVGNFCAAMISMLGTNCTVYEKRDSYIRQINLKIEKDFLKQVGKVMNRISRREDTFFQEINEQINQKKGKILLKTLQGKLKQHATKLGATYIIGKEIKYFEQIQQLHKNNPLILDCTGRNSPLRINKFGADQQNMKIHQLHHALHINFKASVPKKFDFQLLYPVIKNSNDLKLGEVIVSKKKDAKQKYAHVTVPLFISDKLSDIIDKKYPNINRNPLKPFSIQFDEFKIQEEVEKVVYSLFCAFSMEDWQIDWKSVVLKKINITCGYAFKRSNDKHICLGDSAAHFAYFKSLNFGLKHAFELVKLLSGFNNLAFKLSPFDQKDIVNRFWKANPLLWPVKARQSSSPSNYYITTNQVGILAPYTYNIVNNSSTRISLLPQIKQQKIEHIFDEHEEEMKQLSWQHYLDKFEKIRKFDIDMEIMSNRNKKLGSEMVSYLIWLNGLSPIKLSQTISLVANGYYLDKNDFQFFYQAISSFKISANDWHVFCRNIIKKVEETKQKKSKVDKEFQQFGFRLLQICRKQQFMPSQFCELVLNFKWDNKSNKDKQINLLYKALQIIGNVISNQTLLQQQNIMKQVNPQDLALS